jgi:hypothetical protein
MQTNLLTNLTEIPLSQHKFVKAAMAEAARRKALHSSIVFWEEIAPAFNSFAQEGIYKQMEDDARAAKEWGLANRARHMQNVTRRLQKVASRLENTVAV